MIGRMIVRGAVCGPRYQRVTPPRPQQPARKLRPAERVAIIPVLIVLGFFLCVLMSHLGGR